MGVSQYYKVKFCDPFHALDGGGLVVIVPGQGSHNLFWPQAVRSNAGSAPVREAFRSDTWRISSLRTEDLGDEPRLQSEYE